MGVRAGTGRRIVLTAPLTEVIDHAGYFIQMGMASLPIWLEGILDRKYPAWRELEYNADGTARYMPAGLRVNTLQGALTFKRLGVDVSQDKTWVDPVAGLTLRTPPGHLLQLRVYSEIGGFGAGSDLAWQVFPTVGINFTDKLSLDLGYRWLDMDYTTGEGNQQFTYDVLTQGPVAGIGFRF